VDLLQPIRLEVMQVVLEIQVALLGRQTSRPQITGEIGKAAVRVQRSHPQRWKYEKNVSAHTTESFAPSAGNSGQETNG
jgi:hypothetical protein